MSSMPQYNPNPDIPVGFIGSDTNLSQHMSQRQHTQQYTQPEKRHILFFQPSCAHSHEFLKLLNFSKELNNRFIRINVLTPNQKIPDKVQVTPTIFTVPDYNMYEADDLWKLTKAPIKEHVMVRYVQQGTNFLFIIHYLKIWFDTAGSN